MMTDPLSAKDWGLSILFGVGSLVSFLVKAMFTVCVMGIVFPLCTCTRVTVL